MKKPHPLIHPILIFVFSICAFCASLALFIHWYIKITNTLEAFVTKFKIDPKLISDPHSWMMIIITTCLLALIIVGMSIIFTYYQKSQQLYRLQENFINNFTHELKTPLASIKLYLETFLKYKLDQNEQTKFINYMLKDTERLSSHVNQILQLANIENKNVNYPFELVDLEGVINNFLQQNAHLFHGGDIHLETINPSKSSFLYAINVPLFEILLINLLTNAFRYNDRRPQVEIELNKKSNQILMAFKDNGIGIRAKNFKNIFKKFFQEGKSEDRTARGSGLGLYLVQQIVKYHKGKIWVESSGQNEGSTFYVSLPVSKNPFTQTSFKLNENGNEFPSAKEDK